MAFYLCRYPILRYKAPSTKTYFFLFFVDDERTYTNPSHQFSGKAKNTEKSCKNRHSKLHLSRQQSCSDGALYIKQKLIADIPEEVHKCYECVTQSKIKDFYCDEPNFNMNRFHKNKENLMEGITKVSEIMSRFLRRNSQKKDGFIERIISKNDACQENSCLLRHAVRKNEKKRVIKFLTIRNAYFTFFS